MGYYIRSAVIVLFTLAIAYVAYESDQKVVRLSAVQKYANFNEYQLDLIRSLIRKAGNKYASNYDLVSLYVMSQFNDTYPSYWNIAVYKNKDYNSKFYLTGTYDDTHQNKRYYQATDVDPFGFSILILQTNNTDNSLVKSKISGGNLMKKIQLNHLQSEPELISKNGLQYSKKKSPLLSTSQEAGIDLAITTAYTWNKNVVDFTKVLQRLTQTNLNQKWQVCTRFDNLDPFSFLYTSVYYQWIQYSGYGLGSYVLHVYLYRNYASGIDA